MSLSFRRVIVNRIARCLRRNSPMLTQDVERLEKEMLYLMKVNPVSKNSKDDTPQFSIQTNRTNLLSFNEETFKTFSEGDQIEKCNLDKHNKLNIKVNKDYFTQQVLSSIHKLGSQYGYDVVDLKKKHVLVEYSSPNIAKPFHVGHLHSTIIGNFISNLYEALGHKVTRLNYLGDWGTQLSLLILGYQRYGDDNKLSQDPLHHLFQVYVKIHQDVEKEKKELTTMDGEGRTYQEGLELFQKLESGDENLTNLWKRFRDISLQEYNKMYERLGMRFDEVHCESFYKDSTQKLIENLKEKGILKTRENGVGYIDIISDGETVPAIMNKSDGSTLYLSRDVAAAIDRYERFNFDSIHYVVGEAQRFHFKMLLNVLNQIHPAPWNSVDMSEFHITFGRVDGMSSRKGTVVFLRDILDEARKRVHKSLQETKTTKIDCDFEETADRLGMSSIIVQYLQSRRNRSYTFSWDKMLNFKSDSGLFLQYCHARLYNMEQHNDIRIKPDIDVTCLQDVPAYILVQHLARYPDVVLETFQDYEPFHIVQYLFKLGHLANNAYKHLPVKNQSQEIAEARLTLFNCTRRTLANGLKLLGVEPINRM